MRRSSLPAIISYCSYAIGIGFAISILIALFPQWWLFDLFSHFRIQYVLAGFLLLPVFLWLKKYGVAAVATVAIITHSYALWPYLQANVPNMHARAKEHSKEGTRILFANIYYKSLDMDAVKNLIKKNNPDVIVFAEVNEKHYGLLVTEIGKVYPYHGFKDGLGAYDISYFSKNNPEAEAIYFTEDNPSWWLTYQQNGKKMNILGIHPHSPSSQKTSRERNAHLDAALSYAAESKNPTVVVGDFNISQFSKVFQDLLEENKLIDTQLEFGLQPSWHAQVPSLFRIPIDQVIVNDKVKVIDRYVGEYTGSDHFPVIISVSM